VRDTPPPMSERRLLAVLALLLGLVGALLVLINFRLPRENQDFVVWLGGIAVDAVLALVAIGGSLLIYGSKYRAGGIINVVAGIAILIVTSTTSGLLIIFSGVLGLVAAGTFDEYRYTRRR